MHAKYVRYSYELVLIVLKVSYVWRGHIKCTSAFYNPIFPVASQTSRISSAPSVRVLSLPRRALTRATASHRGRRRSPGWNRRRSAAGASTTRCPRGRPPWHGRTAALMARFFARSACSREQRRAAEAAAEAAEAAAVPRAGTAVEAQPAHPRLHALVEGLLGTPDSRLDGALLCTLCARRRPPRAFQMQASGRTATRAREARALTFSSLVDACGRALVGFAVRQPQATAVLPLVAPWALRIIARTVVIVRPSSLFRACLGTLAHELLESRPASVAAVWAGVSGRRGRSRRLGHDWGGFSDRIGGRRPEERVLFGHWSAYRARRGEGRFQPRNGLTPTSAGRTIFVRGASRPPGGP